MQYFWLPSSSFVDFFDKTYLNFDLSVELIGDFMEDKSARNFDTDDKITEVSDIHVLVVATDIVVVVWSFIIAETK